MRATIPNAYAAGFDSGDLSIMRCGAIELGVPVREGVIQIGAGGDLGVSRIRVVITRATVHICRVDGMPLQVAIVDQNGLRTNAGADCRVTRSNVFQKPVDALILRRVGGDAARRPRWYPVGGYGNISRRHRIKQLADTVGKFGVAQQRISRPVVV